MDIIVGAFSRWSFPSGYHYDSQATISTGYHSWRRCSCPPQIAVIAPLGATEHPEYLLAQLGELYNRMSGLAGRFARAGALWLAGGGRGVRAASAPRGPGGTVLLSGSHFFACMSLFFCRSLLFNA